MKRRNIAYITGTLILLTVFGIVLLGGTNKNDETVHLVKGQVLGMFEREPLFILEESAVSPNGKFYGELYRGTYQAKERYYELFVTDLTHGSRKRIFSGDPRTLGWEWTKDNMIKIVYNCGTGCLAEKIIRLDESLTYDDYKDGQMNQVNDWRVKFSKSF